MASDLQEFAFSFSHATIQMNGKIYTAIDNVSFDQPIERSFVFGTSRNPLKRSAGQVQGGEGAVNFSDLEEGMTFYADLGVDPSSSLFDVEVTFSNKSGATRSFELLSCALTAISGDFESGADAMGIEFPFDFMRVNVDQAEFSLD